MICMEHRSKRFGLESFSITIRKNKKAPSEDTIPPKVLFLYPVADYEYPQQL